MGDVILNKLIKKYGNSTVIIFNKEDLAIISKNFEELNKGDFLEFKILKITKK